MVNNDMLTWDWRIDRLKPWLRFTKRQQCTYGEILAMVSDIRKSVNVQLYSCRNTAHHPGHNVPIELGLGMLGLGSQAAFIPMSTYSLLNLAKLGRIATQLHSVDDSSCK